MRKNRLLMLAAGVITLAGSATAALAIDATFALQKKDALRYSCQIDGTTGRVEIYNRTKVQDVAFVFNRANKQQAGLVAAEDLGASVRYETTRALNKSFEIVLFNPEDSRGFTGILALDGETPQPMSCLDHDIGPYAVTAYRNTYYEGSFTTLSLGFHNVKDLTGRDHAGNNAVSSLRIPNGVVAILCDQNDGKGNCWAHIKSIPKFTRDQNDKATSIGVFRVAL